MPNFVKTPGGEIPGTSTYKKRGDWVPVRCHHFGIANLMQSSRKAHAGEVEGDSLSFTRDTDSSSVAFLRYVCTAEVIPQMILEVCDSDGNNTVNERYTLTNVKVHSCHITTDEAGKRTESTVVLFEKVQVEIKKPQEAAMVALGWSSKEAEVV
jgi:type VI protein secretion system component Hcp